jgi:membrane fusion protein, multidrug efflux system
MEAVCQAQPVVCAKRRAGIAIAGILLLSASVWVWYGRSPAAKVKETGAIQVISAQVAQADVPVKLTANGTVSARQMVEVRPQISATVKTVHMKEGQFVRKGDRLFTLDARTEIANLSKAEAQAVKDRTDLASAERSLERQRQLFRQEYISQAEFDLAQNQVDGLRNQLAIDQASVEANRVARGYSEITAPIAGRTGVIAVYPGSLVQPNSTVLVNITQIAPINISFTLPERELATLRQAFAKGEVPVSAELDQSGQPSLKGRLVFVDNAVDTASGSIRLKAEFPNADNRLWPGMFVTVTLAPRTLTGAATVPVQAVQTGPEKKFLYVIKEGSKVAALPVTVRLIQDGIAVIEGAAPGARVVVEGAQNLRPGSVVAESESKGQKTEGSHNNNNGKGSAKPDGTGKQ